MRVKHQVYSSERKMIEVQQPPVVRTDPFQWGELQHLEP